MKKNILNIQNYFARRLRLTYIVGSCFRKDIPSSFNIEYFQDVGEFVARKRSLLRADLMIISDSVDKDNLENVADNIFSAVHDEGYIYICSSRKKLSKFFFRAGFKKTKLKNLLIKKELPTPKIYGIDYLRRWGDTDFLKNWKIAGEQILAHLPKGVDKDKVMILDVGCLNGYIMETLRMHGVRNIFGNDLSFEIAIRQCISKYHLSAITIGDFCLNNYPDKCFDMIIAMEVLEHVPVSKTNLFIRELKRVTKDSGVILLSVSEDMSADPTHVNCRSRSEWYYDFSKHGLVRYGKQTIFPGFNSFVFKKPTNNWETFVWKTLFGLIRTLSLSKINEFIFLLKHFIIKKLLDEKIAKITYSQCGEDLIIKHIFDSLKIYKPSYIDIGAYHPFQINNTVLFYLNGSRGINIEPNIKNFKLFLRGRKRDVNLNVGIAGKQGYLDYYEMSVPSLNTFSKKEAESYVKQGYGIGKISKVEVKTINKILKKYWNNQFPQLLSIDVEGMEFEILQTINFVKKFPLVICVEAISFSTSGKGKKNTKIIDYIKNQGYLLYADTNINNIFVRKDYWLNR